MPEYLSPGVYVEEVDAGPKPIEGVSTSTAGAIGVTARGPSKGKPELVTSFNEFVRKFGGYLPEPDPALEAKWALDAAEGGKWWQFALSVKGFFDNGGQRLYVKRVTAASAVAASIELAKGVASELTKDAAATDTTLRVRHVLGVAAGNNVNLFVNGADIGAFTVSAYDAGANSVTLNNPIGVEARAGRDFIEIIARTTEPLNAADKTLVAKAKSTGEWGDRIRVRVRPMVGASLRILPDPVLADPLLSTTVQPAAPATKVDGPLTVIPVANSAGFANGNHVTVLGREHTVTATAAGTITLNPGIPAGGSWSKGTSIQRLRRANDSAAPGPTVTVQGASQIYVDALVELDDGSAKQVLTVSSISGSVVTLSGNVTLQLFEGYRMRVIEAQVEADYVTNGTVEVSESFQNLRLLDDKSMSYIVRQVNLVSKLIDLELAGGNPLSNTLTNFPAVSRPTAPTLHRLWVSLAGGDDKANEMTVDDFVGVDGGTGARTGIQAFEDIDEISICLAPGMWSGTVQSGLIQHCEILKDRFAVLDPRYGLSIEGIREFREPLDSKYAALYYPWIEVRDPSVQRNVTLAPSAHMAGIYARVDVERGVHKAPGNEVIRGITRIAQDVTKREQDMLNPRGINALRAFPGRGNRVWGARTISSDSSWKYINVRRLFIFVEESIDEGTQWVVFEPNDEPTWSRVRLTITNFLTTVWRNGALQGAKAEEAFFVRCDYSTMSQDDIDNGRLICQIGIAPVKPAEFVIFRIQQKTIESQQN
jgi:phage tail sheath protein FI